MNNNNDHRIVLNPSSITSNAVSPPANTNDRHCIPETLVDLREEEISNSILQSTQPNVLVSHERQLHQIVRPSYSESNTSYRSGGAQTALLSRDYDAYSNFRYSPPPPYDLCQIPNPSIQPAPYQILPVTQHQNAQYLHQQRLQYPQQESLQYHEEFSGYPQPQRMPYSHQRDGNLPGLYEPSSTCERYTCNTCLMVDTMCCCFCVLPICLLIFLLYFASTSGF